MSRFSEIFTHGDFCLETCTKEKVEMIANQFGEMNSAIATSLDAIGTVMFWVSVSNKDPYEDNKIPFDDAMSAFSGLGELMQVLSVLSAFPQVKDVQCRDALKLIENNETPKTAINGASNIQSNTI